MSEVQYKTFSKIYHHKYLVLKELTKICQELMKRMETHDDSKFDDEEFPLYVQASEELENVEYGTDKYIEITDKYKNISSSHLKKNRHHPEYHTEGINGMNLVDVIEMLCDWKAANAREKDVNILQSIDINAKRFGIDDQLKKILINTVNSYEMI